DSIGAYPSRFFAHPSRFAADRDPIGTHPSRFAADRDPIGAHPSPVVAHPAPHVPPRVDRSGEGSPSRVGHASRPGTARLRAPTCTYIVPGGPVMPVFWACSPL